MSARSDPARLRPARSSWSSRTTTRPAPCSSASSVRAATGSTRPPDGASALERWEAARPDVVLLDLGLPDMDGLEVIRRIRREAMTPIVILSGRFAEREKVEALDRGADDYVTKPFGLDELHARLRVALRRAAGPAGDLGGRITVGPMVFDAGRHEVSIDGQAGRPDAARVRAAPGPARRAGPRRDQGQAAPRRLGPGLPGRGQLCLRPRQPAASQARRGGPGRGAARPDRHRARGRLPRPRAGFRGAVAET